MLGHIYRIVRNFEQEHGVLPNLLFLNRFHSEHLESSFSENYTLCEIMGKLQMELVIDHEIIHPRVAWTDSAIKMTAS